MNYIFLKIKYLRYIFFKNYIVYKSSTAHCNLVNVTETDEENEREHFRPDMRPRKVNGNEDMKDNMLRLRPYKADTCA